MQSDKILESAIERLENAIEAKIAYLKDENAKLKKAAAASKVIKKQESFEVASDEVAMKEEVKLSLQQLKKLVG